MRKVLLISVFVLVLIAGGTLGYTLLNTYQNRLTLEKDTVQVELGVKRGMIKPEMFIDDKEILKKVTMETDLGGCEVGTYEVKFHYQPFLGKEQTARGYLVIKDTESPVIECKTNKIYIEQNAENVDISKYFSIKDYSKVTITYHIKSLNTKKAGNYKTTIIATDEYRNETKKTVDITVVPSEDVWNGKEALTEYINGHTPVTKETAQKIKDKTIGDVNVKKRKTTIKETTQPDTDNKDKKTEQDNKDKTEKEDKKTEKTEKTDKPAKQGKGTKDDPVIVHDKCLLEVPSNGIVGYEEAKKQAESYIAKVGLAETHTYRLEKGITNCGQVYYTFNIIIKQPKEAEIVDVTIKT